MRCLCGRIGGTGHHHPWLSRDYEDIDCRATGCLFNRNGKCMTPSCCKIGEDGRCQGFRAPPMKSIKEGD